MRIQVGAVAGAGTTGARQLHDEGDDGYRRTPVLALHSNAVTFRFLRAFTDWLAQRDIATFAAVTGGEDGLRTQRIHPDTMSSLLAWSLRLVEHLADSERSSRPTAAPA